VTIIYKFFRGWLLFASLNMVYSAVMMMVIIISMVYDIYLLQLGFHTAAVVGKLVQKQERDSYVQKTETIHKTTQKHKMHKIGNKYTKQENKHKDKITTKLVG
jgi:hypothetical protein